MWSAELDESQAGIKIAERNINNLKCADDTTLTSESKEELRRFLMRVKEESEPSLDEAVGPPPSLDEAVGTSPI